jgi:NAD-dependent SIR2 family protein deacetylase
MELDSFAIPSKRIPRCLHCGSLLEPNIRKGSNFVESPWMKKYAELDEFLRGIRSGKLLLLELGVGFNTPSIIRYPFERLTAARKDSVLVRVNPEEVTTTFPDAAPRTRAYSMDAGAFLALFVEAMGHRGPVDAASWGCIRES